MTLMVNYFERMASGKNKQSVWWFHHDANRLLILKKDFAVDYLVHSFTAGEKKKTLDLIVQDEVYIYIG